MSIWIASFLAGLSTTVAVIPQADLPPGLQNALAEHLGTAGGRGVLYYHRRDFPLTGRALYTIKTVDAGGSPGTACFDETFVPLPGCGVQLSKQEWSAQWGIQGAMDDELYLATLASDDLTALPVLVWLPTHEPTALRDVDQTGPEAYINAVNQHEAAKQAARESFALDLAALGAVTGFYDPIVPAVWLQLTKGDLALVADWNSVAAVYLDIEHMPGGSTSYPSTVEASGTGYDGNNIRSCVVESNRPNTPNNLGSYGLFCPGDGQDQHSRCVAAIMKSTVSPYGISPGVRQRVNSWGGACGANAGLAFADCKNQGANVWNWSHTCGTGDRRVLDYYVKVSPYPLISVLAGNSDVCGVGGNPWCPVYNAIVVGGVDDQGTSSRSDDTLYGGTCYGNPSGDWEFPHLCAPAVDIDADGYRLRDGDEFCGTPGRWSRSAVARAEF